MYCTVCGLWASRESGYIGEWSEYCSTFFRAVWCASDRDRERHPLLLTVPTSQAPIAWSLARSQWQVKEMQSSQPLLIRTPARPNKSPVELVKVIDACRGISWDFLTHLSPQLLRNVKSWSAAESRSTAADRLPKSCNSAYIRTEGRGAADVLCRRISVHDGERVVFTHWSMDTLAL